MINKNTNDIDQHYQDLMNKAAGSVISKYIFQIKKYKIDPTKPRPTKDDFYELIKIQHRMIRNSENLHLTLTGFVFVMIKRKIVLTQNVIVN